MPVVSFPDTWDPEVRYAQFSVGVDCGERAAAPVETAAAMAHDLGGARVVVMHAW